MLRQIEEFVLADLQVDQHFRKRSCSGAACCNSVNKGETKRS
jgi:hypothetical protein